MLDFQLKKQILKIFFIGVLLGLFSPGFSVMAQDTPPSDDDVNRIAGDLYCPVCENVPLDACTTPACDQWRALIREKLEEGWTDQEIKDYFVAQYGDRVLAEPPRQGVHWLIYILPPAAILTGIVALVCTFKRRPGEQNTDDLEDIDPYLDQVERDLRALDRKES